MTRSLTSRLSTGIPLALVVVVGWLLLEAFFRVGFAIAGVLTLEPLVGSVRAAAVSGSFVALLVGFPIAAALLSRYALAAGQVRADWEYDWSYRALAVGLAAGLLGLGAVTVAQPIDAALFGSNEAATTALVGAIEATPWIAAVLLVGNGIVVPAAEERVWRAIAQTAFVDRLGLAGIVVTAVLFSLKHAVIDASLSRLFTITVLGLVWGTVRHRWGTGASTVAHLTTNTLATAGLLVTALG